MAALFTDTLADRPSLLTRSGDLAVYHRFRLRSLVHNTTIWDTISIYVCVDKSETLAVCRANSEVPGRSTTINCDHLDSVLSSVPDAPVATRDASAIHMRAAIPSPTHGRTSFAWDDALRDGPWDAHLVDALGRTVREWRAIRVPRVMWDGASEDGRLVATGVYFLRVESESGRASTHVMLIR